MIDMLDHLDPEVQLVLLGGRGAAEPDLAAAIDGSACSERVHRLGRVPDRERDALLAHAEALVFPSEYEGFGAPLVEAMALGTPVVCSQAPAVVEVVGEAGIVVSERSGSEWAAAVERARSDRDELVAAGRRRRTDFELAVSGAAVVGAYRLAASR